MQWHQLDHMRTICTSPQTDNHTSTSSLIFTGRVLFFLRTFSRELEATTGETADKLHKNIHDELYSLDLGIDEARDLTQNRPLCILLSVHSAIRTRSGACYYGIGLDALPDAQPTVSKH